jgi:2-dehydropantoate 2-reductase
MRIAILGAGAMGSVFGGHLALAGHDVTLVDIRRDHMEAVRRNGLEMRTPDGTSVNVKLGAISDGAELGPVEIVIVLCKGFATAQAARSIVHAVGPDTWIATVQNGLGNDRRLAEVFGPEHVIPGTTTVGAEQYAPGVTIMNPAAANRTSITHLGPPRGAPSLPDGVRGVAQVLTDAGLPARALESADVVIWTKLALAGPMGPLTALLRRTVRDVANDEHSFAVIHDMFDEIVSVAHASGVPLDDEQTWAHCQETFQGAGPHVTSMAADVLGRRRTEIDSFCGEVTRLGEELGVPTPVNRTVWRLITAMEATYVGSLAETAPQGPPSAVR